MAQSVQTVGPRAAHLFLTVAYNWCSYSIFDASGVLSSVLIFLISAIQFRVGHQPGADVILHGNNGCTLSFYLDKYQSSIYLKI